MFNFKQESREPDMLSEPEEMVACETCKCLLYKKDAQEIRQMYSTGVRFMVYSVSGSLEYDSKFYCGVHTKPYQEVMHSPLSGSHYYAKVEVTEEGIPVGYIKESVKRKSGRPLESKNKK